MRPGSSFASERPEPADPGAGVDHDQAAVVAAHLHAGGVAPVPNGLRSRRGQRAATAPHPGSHEGRGYYWSRFAARRKAERASSPNSTNRTRSTRVSAPRTAPMATGAASSSGYPNAPVEIAGKATLRAPISSATRSDSVWQDASRAAGSLVARVDRTDGVDDPPRGEVAGRRRDGLPRREAVRDTARRGCAGTPRGSPGRPRCGWRRRRRRRRGATSSRR